LLDDEILKKEELSAYFDTIIIKDIARRYKNSNIDEIKKLAYYFLSNNTKLFSINSLKKNGLASL
jgi:predicted AAA+ superfamily ATPase